MFAALPTYRPSLPHPGATPNVSSVTRERCTRAAGETTMFTALPTYKPSLPRCPAAPRQRGTTPRVSSVTLERCPRAAGATSMFAIFPTCEPSLSRCPASFPILLRTSLPSRASVAPTQRVQPPCLKPFQHTSRLCLTPALPHTSLPSRANAAPAQRARRAFCSLSNVQAVALSLIHI